MTSATRTWAAAWLREHARRDPDDVRYSIGLSTDPKFGGSAASWRDAMAMQLWR